MGVPSEMGTQLLNITYMNFEIRRVEDGKLS
jgi:hypothetical protein